MAEDTYEPDLSLGDKALLKHLGGRVQEIRKIFHMPAKYLAEHADIQMDSLKGFEEGTARLAEGFKEEGVHKPKKTSEKKVLE